MSRRDYSVDFFDFGDATYLNCAYHGAMPRVAIRAVEESLALKKTPHLIRDDYHFTLPDAYRAAVATLLGADGADVAVTNSATQGVMILAGGLDWRPGDEVVLPRSEFPANLFPWRALESRGVTVHEVELSEEDPVASLESSITDRTRVVSASWVSYSTGLRLDVHRLGRICRERGVLFAIDASQGLGGLPLSVTELDCDLIACAGYKWLLGPYGVGFAWVRPALAERLTAGNVNWFSLRGARDFSRLSDCELEFDPGARRFDVNEPGNFFNMAGAEAALTYLLEVGPAQVHAHAQSLLERLVDGLPSRMHSLAPTEPDQRSNILCIAHESEREAAAAHERLVGRRIHLSRREGALRISPHLYNTEADIDRLLETLHES